MNEKPVALITGATGSVGRVLVSHFAESNLYKAIYAIYKTREHVALELANHLNVVPLRVDLEDEALGDVPKDVSVLVNNAGAVSSKSLAGDVSILEVDRLIELHVKAPLRLAKHCLPHMVRSKWGRIINVGSIWSLRGSERNTAYTLSKHALTGLTKSIAIEYAKFGITCNEVCPGPIESEMMETILGARAEELGKTTKEVKDQFISSLRTGRMVRAAEVVAVISFLASSASSGVNGVSIPVDAGLIV